MLETETAASSVVRIRSVAAGCCRVHASPRVGHPAMPGRSAVGGLPVGLMLVGKHFDEPTVLRAAHAFEQATDWRKR